MIQRSGGLPGGRLGTGAQQAWGQVLVGPFLAEGPVHINPQAALDTCQAGLESAGLLRAFDWVLQGVTAIAVGWDQEENSKPRRERR